MTLSPPVCDAVSARKQVVEKVHALRALRRKQEQPIPSMADVLDRLAKERPEGTGIDLRERRLKWLVKVVISHLEVHEQEVTEAQSDEAMAQELAAKGWLVEAPASQHAEQPPPLELMLCDVLDEMHKLLEAGGRHACASLYCETSVTLCDPCSAEPAKEGAMDAGRFYPHVWRALLAPAAALFESLSEEGAHSGNARDFPPAQIF